MPIIKKPTFPQGVDPARLTRSLDAIQSKVESLKGADGHVSVEKLKESVADDPVVSEDLAHILDEFDAYVPLHDGLPSADLNPREVRSSCSGLTGWSTSPSELDQGQVSTVMNLLLAVKGEVKAADKDGDGVLSEVEVEHARSVRADDLPLLQERLFRTAMYDADPEVKQFFDDAAEHKSVARSFTQTVNARHRASDLLTQNAEHHAASPEAAEALKWAYRSLLITASSFSMDVLPDRMEREMEEAETSLFRFVPFSTAKSAKGHLGDREVLDHLETNDLKTFAEAKKAEVLAAVGGDWDAWLEGAGLDRPE